MSGNSNKRTDEYGGSLENRMRFPLEVARAVRAAWPADKPLWLRFSSTDFKDIDHFAHDKDGWDIYQAIEYAKELKKIGVDVIDCSAGANLSGVKYPTAPVSIHDDLSAMKTTCFSYIFCCSISKFLLQKLSSVKLISPLVLLA